MPEFDTTRLKDISGGNADMEKKLFMLFFTSCEQCLAKLQEGQSTWQEAMHELKGVAANMGMEPLAQICEAAYQAGDGAPDEVKGQALRDIYDEVEAARSFFDAHYA